MSWIKHILISLLAVLLVVEEWLWDVLTLFGGWLSQRLRLQAFELWLSQTSRWLALLAFLLPLLIVMPMNVAAFWLIAEGKVLRGIVLEIVAKLLGTVLVARVFALTKRQLLTFRTFAWLYDVIMRALKWAKERVVNTSVYKAAKHLRGLLLRKKSDF